MPVVSRLARPLIASIFVTSGATHLRHPGLVTDLAEPVTSKLAGALPMLPDDAAIQVRINAAVEVVGGMLLGFTKRRRLGAALLIASLLPMTWAGHAFWTEDDPTERHDERVQFQKNLAILGALLLVLVDRGGKPSIGWRARRTAAAAIAASPLPLG